ncbi:MAG: hypothetical protein K9G69_03400 [Candidatus Nanopelagicales bacterium]|nr:hypothetical protein [Candidatus Nanopelagicales bacterium]
MVTRYFLDAGQSGVRVRQESHGLQCDFKYPGLVTSQPLARQIVNLISSHIAAGNQVPTSVHIGATAVANSDTLADQLLQDLAPLGVQSLVLTHDSISGFLGALHFDTGVVIAAGTGIVTFAASETTTARVDGWGNIIGDAGSGFWIGRKALDAALRAHDGRAGRTLLTELAQSEFPDLELAYIELQQDENRVARIANLAQSVISIAEFDEVARCIVFQATEEMLYSASAALSRIGYSTHDSPAVSWTGNIAKSSLVSEYLEIQFQKSWPNARIIEPFGDPLEGVTLVHKVADGSPLAQYISIRDLNKL